MIEMFGVVQKNSPESEPVIRQTNGCSLHPKGRVMLFQTGTDVRMQSPCCTLVFLLHLMSQVFVTLMKTTINETHWVLSELSSVTGPGKCQNLLYVLQL